MFTKIIAGHDLHSGGDDALALGRKLAEATHAELVVAGVFPFGTLPVGFEALWREEEEKIATRIQALAAEADAEAEAFPASSPARGLHGLAEEIVADLIVVGSSRHSKLGQVLAGNVGARLLHGSPCAVAVAPGGYADEHGKPLDTFVVGIDGSVESRLALEDAVELARRANARLNLVAVAELSPVAYGKGRGQAGWNELFEAIEERARDHLDEAVSSIPNDVASEGSLVSGDPAVKLADAGRARGTLLILGSRAYGPARRVLLGSVSEALVKAAPCPVLVHPRGAEAEAAPRAARAGSAGARS
jgi:nucleotide-binding universal stress UspA family protein